MESQLVVGNRGMEVSSDCGLNTYEVQIQQGAYEMDPDEGCRVPESSRGELGICEDHAIQEPYEGMEFESEDAAKIFYDEYSRRLGFFMRVMSCRRSERDGRILARRLGCNKEGHCVSIRGNFGSVRKPRSSSREGCKAMIHVKYDKSGKWVITKFVKDHNHPLVVSPREARQTMVGSYFFSNYMAMIHVKYDKSGKWVITKFVKDHNHPLVVSPREARQTMDEKDKKIQELTAELRNKKRLCATYQEDKNS